jgi:hypothetical protein
MTHLGACKKSTGECCSVAGRQECQKRGWRGEPFAGGSGCVAVLGEDGPEFADDVADGASADVEQLGEGVVGAQVALVEHGGEDLFGVGDLLGEDAAAGAGQGFSSAASVTVPLGAGPLGSARPAPSSRPARRGTSR